MKFSIKEINPNDSSVKPDEFYAKLASVYGNAFKPIAILNKGQEQVAICLLYQYNKLWETHLITPPFLPHNLFTSLCPSINPAQVSSFEKDIIQTLSDYISHQKASFIEIIFPSEVIDLQPFLWKKFELGVHYTQVIDLNQSNDLILDNMSTQRRKNIRDAENKNYLIKDIIDSELITENTLANLETKGASINHQIVENFSKEFINTPNGICKGIYFNDELISYSFCIHNHKECFYLFGSNNSNGEHKNIGAYSLWLSIVESKKQGCKTFNFCGSSIPSIEKYFRGFGAQLMPQLKAKKDNRLKASQIIKPL